jgi:uncharacterized delta-60 repeat protein
MRKNLSVLIFVSLILFAGLLVAPGAQEPTARRKGYTVTHESGGVWGRVVALQPDGGIVLGGFSKNGKDRFGMDKFRLLLLRFTPDGRLDPAFNGGSVTTALGEVGDVLHGVAAQSDGRIVAAGAATRASNKDHGRPETFSLVRYTPAGRLDETFGDGGKVLTQVSTDDLSHASVVMLQPDGKILVAGSALTQHWWPLPVRRWDFAVVRYMPTGRLDTSFGSGGKAVHSVGDVSEDSAADMALQPDGKIVLVGSAHVRYPADIGLLRLKPNGGRDRSFGDGGRVVTQWKGGNSASSVTIQSDGKILVVAATGIVLRYLPDGKLDPTFGDAGAMPVASASHIVLQPDGKILLASLARLARYLPDWRLDPSFGSAGTTTVDAGRNFRPGAPVLQPDGRILLGGSSVAADGQLRFTMARCNPDGTLDSTFGDPE